MSNPGFARPECPLGRADAVQVGRPLHEFYDGRLELGPTNNDDTRDLYIPSSVMRNSRRTCGCCLVQRVMLTSSSDPLGSSGTRRLRIVLATARRRTV